MPAFAVAVVQLLVVATVVFACAQVPAFRGLRVASFGASLAFALLFGLLYAGLGYVAAPLSWITLGLFGVVVAAVALELADFFVDAVEVRGWGWALALAIVVATANAAVTYLLGA